ncbi:MAG: terminase small subunit [Actinomycetota bacterium]|nr:terminase small subunit [Actinomycetota bacterium]
MKKLTPRQQRFVAEYVADPNATQAAIRAGYSPRTAYSIGPENLKKPEIEAVVEEARAELAERAGVERDRVMEEFRRVAFSDLRDAVEWSGKSMAIRSSSDLTPDAARAIQEVTETVTETPEGGQRVVRRVKLYDKLGALREVAKLIGMYPKDGTGGVQVNVNVDNRPARPLSDLTEEELDFYERILDSGETAPRS